MAPPVDHRNAPSLDIALRANVADATSDRASARAEFEARFDVPASVWDLEPVDHPAPARNRPRHSERRGSAHAARVASAIEAIQAGDLGEAVAILLDLEADLIGEAA